MSGVTRSSLRIHGLAPWKVLLTSKKRVYLKNKIFLKHKNICHLLSPRLKRLRPRWWFYHSSGRIRIPSLADSVSTVGRWGICLENPWFLFFFLANPMYWWFGSLHRPKIPQNIYIYMICIDVFCLFVYFFIYTHCAGSHIKQIWIFGFYRCVYNMYIYIYVNVCFINIYVWVMRPVMNT